VNEVEVKLLEPEDWELGHHFAGGLYAKEMHLPAGGVAISHVHEYDHLSILGKGRAKLTVDGETEILHPGRCITVSAGQTHEIEALDDIIWYCIHAEEVALCRGQ